MFRDVACAGVGFLGGCALTYYVMKLLAFFCEYAEMRGWSLEGIRAHRAAQTPATEPVSPQRSTERSVDWWPDLMPPVTRDGTLTCEALVHYFWAGQPRCCCGRTAR